MKIRPVRAELFHANSRTDGRTDMTNLIVAFRYIADAPKNNKLTYKTYLLTKFRIFSKINLEV